MGYHTYSLLFLTHYRSVLLSFFFDDCVSDHVSTASSSGAYALGFASMTHDLRSTNIMATIGMSMYTLGFALVPLVTSSFSEEFGRQPMYIVSAIGCLLMHLMTAL